MPMRTMAASTTSALALVIGLAALGCEQGKECERARLAASDQWKAVTEQAGQAKLKGWIGFDELSDEKKAEHVREWTSIETQAEMVFKSFAYERITWKTAAPAREKATQTFNGYFAKDSFTVFAAALKSANQQYDTVAQTCGE